MPSILFHYLKRGILTVSIDLLRDTIRVALLTNIIIPEKKIAPVWSDVVVSEAKGPGYISGGQELMGKKILEDDVGGRVSFCADDVSWPNSVITARHAVLYEDTGQDTASPLLCCFDFGEDKSSSNGDFTIQWNTDGIFALA